MIYSFPSDGMVFDYKKVDETLQEKSDDVVKDLILIVDDEESSLNLVRQVLEDSYEVLTATSAREALRVIDEHEVAVVVSDQCMPRKSGTELFEDLEEMKHPASRIILTGFSDHSEVTDALDRGDISFYLIKPVDGKRLIREVRTGVEQFHSNRD